VDRVEVLKDGASAIYWNGRDRRRDQLHPAQGLHRRRVSAYGTQTEHGGGNVRRYTGTIGFGDINKQRFNILASFDYEKDTPLKASQRPDFAGTGIRPDLGFSQTSGNTWPANFVFDGNQLNVTARNGCSRTRAPIASPRLRATPRRCSRSAARTSPRRWTSTRPPSARASSRAARSSSRTTTRPSPSTTTPRTRSPSALPRHR
jgi:hypothetical protein